MADIAEITTPSVPVPAAEGQPQMLRQIDPMVLRNIGARFKALFDRYASERQPSELRWLKNLRQYKGIYDAEVLKQLGPGRSQAYPRITRMKCISLLSRIMNLMFPGNEKSWSLEASPSPEMDPTLVAQAVEELIAERKAAGQDATLTQGLIDEAVRRLADKMVDELSKLIDDQLTELGGSQLLDWIALNRKVIKSGIDFGIGVLEGPYVRTIQTSGWMLVAGEGFKPVSRETYKPMFEFLRCWDFYPDMGAQTLPGEGYFVRKVLGRRALRELIDRPGFLEQQIRQVIINLPGGNYKAKSWETELKAMGTAIHTQHNSAQSSGRDRYEVIIWKGPVSASMLREAGAEIPDAHMADDIEAELWLVDNYVIKAAVNPWRKLGVKMQTVHIFNFDEDDTSPISEGLPQIMRDSALSVAASSRMALDNGSVVCGPNMEVNTTLLRPDQDLTAVQGYKIWYRDDDGISAQFPAVREININSHLPELQAMIKMWLDFAEMETFIGPSTGGDMTKVPSEAMRTQGGASMIFGDAALPFKDIVRNLDSFTQSVIWATAVFNMKFNPDQAPQGDYNVIPRGATSLIAKEMRGIQIDNLSMTMTEEERDHVDERKFVEAKFSVRDLEGMLVSPDVAKQRKESRAAHQATLAQLAQQLQVAEIRKTHAEGYKNITQGQKNAAGADAVAAAAAIDILEAGANDDADAAGANNGAGKKASGGG